MGVPADVLAIERTVDGKLIAELVIVLQLAVDAVGSEGILIVSMARAVNVSIVSLSSIVFDVSSIDGDTTGFLFRSSINLIIVQSLG